VRPSPAKCGFRAGNIPQLDGDGCHGNDISAVRAELGGLL
jgi:hypothetical protein